MSLKAIISTYLGLFSEVEERRKEEMEVEEADSCSDGRTCRLSWKQRGMLMPLSPTTLASLGYQSSSLILSPSS